jgi:hypothetical protein
MTDATDVDLGRGRWRSIEGLVGLEGGVLPRQLLNAERFSADPSF